MKEVFDKLLALYPEYSRIYGPYIRKDGRKVILLYKKKGSAGKRTLSWTKALVEVREGRRLINDEEVDHNNRDFTDDSSENLIIRSRSAHAKLDAKRLVPQKANCLLCGKEFIMTRGQIETKKAGPFCSRSCRGRYGVHVQHGGDKILR